MNRGSATERARPNELLRQPPRRPAAEQGVGGEREACRRASTAPRRGPASQSPRAEAVGGEVGGLGLERQPRHVHGARALGDAHLAVHAEPGDLLGVRGAGRRGGVVGPQAARQRSALARGRRRLGRGAAEDGAHAADGAPRGTSRSRCTRRPRAVDRPRGRRKGQRQRRPAAPASAEGPRRAARVGVEELAGVEQVVRVVSRLHLAEDLHQRAELRPSHGARAAPCRGASRSCRRATGRARGRRRRRPRGCGGRRRRGRRAPAAPGPARTARRRGAAAPRRAASRPRGRRGGTPPARRPGRPRRRPPAAAAGRRARASAPRRGASAKSRDAPALPRVAGRVGERHEPVVAPQPLDGAPAGRRAPRPARPPRPRSTRAAPTIGGGTGIAPCRPGRLAEAQLPLVEQLARHDPRQRQERQPGLDRGVHGREAEGGAGRAAGQRHRPQRRLGDDGERPLAPDQQPRQVEPGGRQGVVEAVPGAGERRLRAGEADQLAVLGEQPGRPGARGRSAGGPAAPAGEHAGAATASASPLSQTTQRPRRGRAWSRGGRRSPPRRPWRRPRRRCHPRPRAGSGPSRRPRSARNAATVASGTPACTRRSSPASSIPPRRCVPRSRTTPAVRQPPACPVPAPRADERQPVLVGVADERGRVGGVARHRDPERRQLSGQASAA